MESAKRLWSLAVFGRSPAVFGRSVDAGAVAGRAARAWPRVLYGAVLGLWSLTGDGASFNAASAASVAADVRWKKFTGMFGQRFNHLTCSLCSAGEAALPPRTELGHSLLCGRGLLVWAVSLREGWPRFGICLSSVLQTASSWSRVKKRAGTGVVRHRSAEACSRGHPASAASALQAVLVHQALGALVRQTLSHPRTRQRSGIVRRRRSGRASRTLSATVHASTHVGGRSTRARKRRQLRHGGGPPARRAVGPVCW